jgi:isoquinoline 1-oxidoreductase beta subunit
MKTPIDRREFFRRCLHGAGLALAISITPSGCTVTTLTGRGEDASKALRPDAWLRITPDDTVSVVVNKSEMGQGVYTSFPMIVADELEADWQRVRFQPAPAGRQYRDPRSRMQATMSSTSVRHMFEALRTAGAAAREMLIRAAAQRWRVPPGECEALDGKVKHAGSGRSLTYGALCLAAAALPVPSNPRLKRAGEFKFIGKAVPRLDVADKVDGSAIFGIDIFEPNMLHASIARPPVYGAQPRSYKKEAAMGIPGVRAVVPTKSGIAVCADTLDAAWGARDALQVAWDEGENPGVNDERLERVLLEHLEAEGEIARGDGGFSREVGEPPVKIEATYVLPYLAHATMEPMNCTAHVSSDRCDVWVPTQNQTGVLKVASQVTGLRPEQIHVHTLYLGGGFGRRFETDFVTEAVRLSKETGKPVKVTWTREEDMQNDFYRPANCCRIEAGFSRDGRVTSWFHKIVAPPVFNRYVPWLFKRRVDPFAVEGLVDMEYEIPAIRVEYVSIDTPVPVGIWRSVGHSHNAFTVESFMDELACAGNRDPLEIRLDLLTNHPRSRRVLEVAAENAGWGRPLREGQARGLAQHACFGSHVAQVAEISVNEVTGTIRVHRVVCAVDCGPVVNPDIAGAQVEGAIIFGLSAALKERVRFANGGVRSENYADYEILRMSETPRIEVHLVKGEGQPGGVGEIGVPPAAPAVANAVFSATGARLRYLPMHPRTVRRAIKRSKRAAQNG